MGRLAGGQVARPFVGGLTRAAEVIVWQTRRGFRAASRQLGSVGWVTLALLVLCLALALIDRQLSRDAELLRLDLAAANWRPPVAQNTTAAGAASDVTDGRARLRAFAEHLLPHDRIPALLEEVLRLAEDEGLVTQRGDYRPQVDVAGGFLRYRMSLPVRGAAPAVHRFMRSALRNQPSLALESVQFKRDRIGVAEIEARIQWVVYAALPPRQDSVDAAWARPVGQER